ncbi:MAG: 3-isopropylmalate dehydrogenase [Cyclobacteriaceae bacterium]
MKAKIAVLPGDGIGPEVIDQALKVMSAVGDAFNHDFMLETGLVGAVAIDATGDPFPEETEKICRTSDAILFGAIGHPKYDLDPRAKVRPEQGLLRMRRQLGLFANIRPVKSYASLSHMSPLKEDRISGVDFEVYRELTGGIYFGEPRGRSENGQKAFDTCVYHKDEILRLAELAFNAAKRRRNKVTLVDKANVLATSRLWREVVTEYAKQFAAVELDLMYVDNAAMKLIQQPDHFDVILTENMFGDILTDEASVITGSLGMLPSASVGKEVALYEPIHGSYPEVAGMNRANPLAAILSLSMMLEQSFGLNKEAKAIDDAVNQTIEEGFMTEDLNQDQPSTTEQVGDRIAELVKSKLLTTSK